MTRSIGIANMPRPLWQITVMSTDSQSILLHAKCEAFEEIRALATEARAMAPDYPIWVREPVSQECFPWD
jgi:hypothetical protein